MAQSGIVGTLTSVQVFLGNQAQYRFNFGTKLKLWTSSCEHRSFTPVAERWHKMCHFENLIFQKFSNFRWYGAKCQFFNQRSDIKAGSTIRKLLVHSLAKMTIWEVKWSTTGQRVVKKPLLVEKQSFCVENGCFHSVKRGYIRVW